ncbi:TrkH family potassium uptake protein [Paenibacillus sepulcri]|uniref:TrkH family potassium uptake protein n=1 Tax=Paenibacillus sepulcri TaxID=359917 RepID=A0ABS7C997_9BACL|nr:TrkH family potassium uptake protein [Paenibacillus sepulcri]
MNRLSSVQKKLKISPPQFLAMGFTMIIVIGTLLLSLPVASIPGQRLGLLDALFMAASAACVTGLSVVDTSTHFTLFGHIVILVMVQLGGLGFMTMATWFALAWGKRVSLKERLILKEAMNQNYMEGIVRLSRRVIIYSLTVEAAAAVLLALRWASEMPLGKALYYGVFHSISIFNNAGFVLINGSFIAYTNDIYINVITMILIVLGGIGFIVLSDLIEYRRTRRLSLHSKVVLSASGILIVFGGLVIFMMEFSNSLTLGPLNAGGKVLASIYQSVSLRSAGTSTIDITGLRESTQFFMIILMFIGAAPGSTGGGIKVTTFVILIGSVITMMRGREDVVLFRNRLSKEHTYKAIMITFIAIALVVSGAMIMSTTQSHSFLKLLFETTSAFGTVGLSLGLTPELTASGKIVIIIMMFIGRMGALTLAYALQPRIRKELYRHPEGKIIIG